LGTKVGARRIVLIRSCTIAFICARASAELVAVVLGSRPSGTANSAWNTGLAATARWSARGSAAMSRADRWFRMIGRSPLADSTA
jgi:hypothetical protein